MVVNGIAYNQTSRGVLGIFASKLRSYRDGVLLLILWCFKRVGATRLASRY